MLQNFNKAEIDCEGPNEFLYKYQGNIKMPEGDVFPMGPNNLCLKGSKLKNTDWVYGICVYSGHETKIMKNMPAAKYKSSDVEKKMNNYIIVLILFQTTVCLIGGIYYAIYYEIKGQCLIYELAEPKECDFDFLDTLKYLLLSSATWFLVLMNFVPISLMVTLEMVKYLQGKFINNDWRMVCPNIGMQA